MTLHTRLMLHTCTHHDIIKVKYGMYVRFLDDNDDDTVAGDNIHRYNLIG